jgi:hypothetical protein
MSKGSNCFGLASGTKLEQKQQETISSSFALPDASLQCNQNFINFFRLYKKKDSRISDLRIKLHTLNASHAV